MRLPVWRSVGATAAILISVSGWSRLPDSMRWPAGGALLFVAALTAFLLFRRSRARSRSVTRVRPARGSRRFSRRGEALARDAVRFRERIEGRTSPHLRD